MDFGLDYCGFWGIRIDFRTFKGPLRSRQTIDFREFLSKVRWEYKILRDCDIVGVQNQKYS